MGAVGGAFEQSTATAAEAMTRLPALNIDRGLPPAKPLPGTSPEWEGATCDSAPPPLVSARFTRLIHPPARSLPKPPPELRPR